MAYKDISSNKKIYFFSFILIIVLFFTFISAFQLLGLSKDYFGYLNIFGYSEKGTRASTEPFFSFVRFFNDIFFASELFPVYFLSAVIAFILKWEAIKKLSRNNYLLVFLSYIIALYWIHEYTQIRAACAIGIYLCSLSDLAEEQYKSFFTKIFIAFLFHYSSIVVVVFFFYSRLFKKKTYIYLPVVGFIFAVIASNLIGGKLRVFIYAVESALGFNKSGNVLESTSPFNLKYLYLLFLFFTTSFFVDVENKIDYLLMKSFSFGLCIYFWLNPSGLPVICVRFAEYFTSVFIIYIYNVCINLPFKEKKLLLFIPVISTLFYGYASMKTAGIL